MNKDTLRKLAVHFLRMAADEFSDHCCNDLDLREIEGLGQEDVADIIRAISDDDEVDYTNKWVHIVPDWLVMSKIADMLERGDL